MPTQDTGTRSGIEIVILDDGMKTFASIQDAAKEYTRQDVVVSGGYEYSCRD